MPAWRGHYYQADLLVCISCEPGTDTRVTGLSDAVLGAT